jgi:phospho-N-acetylmuramoyl-pentapeptide-transferase
MVPLLKRMKIGQRISSYMNFAHRSKEGTPTMGGLIFIISTIVVMGVLLITKKVSFNNDLKIVLFVFVSYAIIGFLDDFLSIKRHNNEGLTEIQKLLLQVVIALVFFFMYVRNGGQTALIVSTLHINIEMGWVYGLFILFLLVGGSNAVNLTDGLDGLAGGLSIICFLIYGMIAWNSPYLAGSEDIAIFCFILVGGLLGFLVFNAHPAKIFMGDTGSLALGGTLATVAILTHREFSLIVIGGVFVIETLSVILQIASVKIRGKRLIPMAPLHHTFEKLGWSETDIVRLFYVVGFILGAGALVYTVWV